MDIVCQSEYQDIYRIKYGVLLIINKFKYTHDCPYIGAYCKSKRYTNECQKELKILTSDYIYLYANKTYKTGQVTYHGYPVELCDFSQWDFQIKTTGESLSGNSIELLFLLNSIANIITKYNDTVIEEVLNENV